MSLDRFLPPDTRAIHWGEVVYGDCLDPTYGLPSFPDQSIDLCITDPPYNVKFKGIAKHHHKTKLLYEDHRADYQDWCARWFAEVQRVCTRLIFTCGSPNLGMWYQIAPPKEILIHYKANGAGCTHLCRTNCYEPILFYGTFPSFTFRANVLKIPLNVGLLQTETLIHPCPKSFELWELILKRVRPVSVLDPFMGSGTTAAVCEKYHIPWCGFEVEPRYASDIRKRLHRWGNQFTLPSFG